MGSIPTMHAHEKKGKVVEKRAASLDKPAGKGGRTKGGVIAQRDFKRKNERDLGVGDTKTEG